MRLSWSIPRILGAKKGLSVHFYTNLVGTLYSKTRAAAHVKSDNFSTSKSIRCGHSLIEPAHIPHRQGKEKHTQHLSYSPSSSPRCGSFFIPSSEFAFHLQRRTTFAKTSHENPARATNTHGTRTQFAFLEKRRTRSAGAGPNGPSGRATGSSSR